VINHLPFFDDGGRLNHGFGRVEVFAKIAFDGLDPFGPLSDDTFTRGLVVLDNDVGVEFEDAVLDLGLKSVKNR